MEKKHRYSTGDFAKKANVTIRTIHHYHDKGLISPSFVGENGYRYYGDDDFARLQKILILKNLGFSLEEIKSISINEKDADFLKQSFDLQLNLVRKKISHLQFVEKSIEKAAKSFEENGQVEWETMTELIQIVDMEKDLVEQYKTGKNIKTRINLHDEYSHNKTGWFRWIFSQIFEGLPGVEPLKDSNGYKITDNLSILEIGCGDGSFWKQNMTDEICEFFKRNNVKIVLSDVSAGMLEDAKANLFKYEDLFEFVVADFEKLYFEDASFDVVIANHVLFYAKDVSQTIKEIRRIICADGIFVAGTYGEKHMKEIEIICKEFDENVSLSRLKLYEKFGIENGETFLKKSFERVDYLEYKDWLEVTEAEPIVDYIFSCHGNQRKILEPKYDKFISFIKKKLSKKGMIKISKQSGIFISRNH